MQNDEHAVAVREGREGGVVAEAVHFSPDVIRDTRTEIALMQDMVRNILTRGVDYGRVPGTLKDGLWDPGAQMIAAGFKCYFGERRILKLEDDGIRIAVVVEVPVISHQTGRVVATGIGAASTLETKYKYRWVLAEEASALGYTENTIATLKSKWASNHKDKLYRIENPEQSELLNTIVKMGSKRGETDAAQSLPGVASALRQLFDEPTIGGQQQRRDNRHAGAQAGQKVTTWDAFWGETKHMRLEQADVYRILGVDHVKDWLDTSHKNLDECLMYLLNHQLNNKTPNPLENEEREPLFDSSDEKTKDIATAWDECRNLMFSLKINQKGLQTWWDRQYSVVVILDEFKQAVVPEKFTSEQIFKFHKSLTELATKRAKEAQAKKGQPTEPML